MAGQTGQNQVAAVTTPVPGGPLSADVVRGHLNAIITAYDAHDNDATIHVESGVALPGSGMVAGDLFLLVENSGVASPTRKLTFYQYTDSAWQKVTGAAFNVTNGQPNLISDNLTGAGATINWAAGPPVRRFVQSANGTITLSNPVDGGTYTIIIEQDGTGGWTPTFSPTINFGDYPPTWGGAAGSKQVISAIYDGTEYLGSVAVVNG